MARTGMYCRALRGLSPSSPCSGRNALTTTYAPGNQFDAVASRKLLRPFLSGTFSRCFRPPDQTASNACPSKGDSTPTSTSAPGAKVRLPA